MSKFLSFFILLVFGEAIFPLGRKVCSVKFETHWEMGLKTIRREDQTFPLGRISLGNFIPKFTYFVLVWIIIF